MTAQEVSELAASTAKVDLVDNHEANNSNGDSGNVESTNEVQDTTNSQPAQAAVDNKETETLNGTGAVKHSEATNGEKTTGSGYVAPDDINADPNRVKFAYWVPNVSGGLVISKIPQRTKYVAHA